MHLSCLVKITRVGHVSFMNKFFSRKTSHDVFRNFSNAVFVLYFMINVALVVWGNNENGAAIGSINGSFATIQIGQYWFMIIIHMTCCGRTCGKDVIDWQNGCDDSRSCM